MNIPVGNGNRLLKPIVYAALAILAPVASWLVASGVSQNRLATLEKDQGRLEQRFIKAEDDRVSKREFVEFRERVLDELKNLREELRQHFERDRKGR